MAATSTLAAEKVEVRVAAYVFAPFLNSDQKTGLTPDLIELLNNHQSKYEFELKPTSANRRYNEIASGNADLIFFEMPEWGWKKRQIEYSITRVFLSGGEVFIAPKPMVEDQSYFDEIRDKHIAAMYGYHYAFANYDARREYLQDNFKIMLAHNPERIIELVASKRVELGIVTKSFLQMHLKEKPHLFQQITVSDRYDQNYNLRAIVGSKPSISKAEFEDLLSELIITGRLQKLLELYGISTQLVLSE